MSAVQVSVSEYRYYFKAIKEYLGLTPNDLFMKQEKVEMNPNLVDEEWFRSETAVKIKEHIRYDAIMNLFDVSKLHVGELKPHFATFIFFVANIYFGNSYRYYLEEYNMSDEAIEGSLYQSVTNENLHLFVALKDYMRAQSWAFVERYNWEENWKETHKSERVSRKKEIIKGLVNDFGEIHGKDWKERESIYNRMADMQLDNEMGREMRAEQGWIDLNEKLEKAGSITIRFGDQKKIVIPNTDFWVNKLLENHVFPRFIPEYSTVEAAKAALKKTAGRPSEDIRVRTLAYGLSRYFMDNKVITTSTSRSLLDFLEKLFKVMNIRCNSGMYPDTSKLEDVIQNAAAAQTKPRFYTQDDERVSPNEESLKDPTYDDIMRWLDDPEVVFAHISK